MFKKTKVRSILELLGKNLSAREVSKVLSVSRNTVAEVQALFLQSGRSWDDISEWDDDRLYGRFYPDKFKYKPRYTPVDYSYVHKELKKTGVTEKLLWEEYCARCEKDGVSACSYITFAKNYKKFTANKNYTSHIEHKPGLEIEADWSGPAMSYTEPDTGERITAYLFVAAVPYSQISYVEAAASMDEKAYLRALPLIPYEVCEWSYGHKVGSNSPIWWNKGQYSVPYRYIGYKVDVKFNGHLVFIYYNRTEIAKHPILSKHMTNGMRTEQAHLPLPLKKNLSMEELCDKARETGPKTFEVIRRMFDEAKVKEQPMQTARAILSIADIYTPEVLEKACDKALRQYHMSYYKTIYSHARSINSAKELTEFKENNLSDSILSMNGMAGSAAERRQIPLWTGLSIMPMNPVVREIAIEVLGGEERIRIIEPMDVVDFHNFLSRSYMILTDSGGIQEEAPSLGKPVLVMRDTTERPEGLQAGTLKLVGTGETGIYNAIKQLLEDTKEYARMSQAINPYGDGFACKRIADVLCAIR